MDETAVSEEFIDRYITLCTTPLNDKDTIKHELDSLLSNPLVSDVAFFDDRDGVYDTLLVGTRAIVVHDYRYGVDRYLGKFIIYLTRSRIGRRWHVEFNLHNIDSHPVVTGVNPEGYPYTWFARNPHPHMYCEPKIHKRFGEVAQLCISVGGFQVYQALRRGKMDLATTYVLKILHTLGPGSAYLDVKHWPIYQEETHDV